MGHLANWYIGWWMLLAAFAEGAVVGLFFQREEFMGGYGSWRRRVMRLGLVALAGLGMLNLVFGISPLPVGGTWQAGGTAVGLIVGGIAMPAVCFLAAWRMGLRHLFVVPVAALVGAVLCVVAG